MQRLGGTDSLFLSMETHEVHGHVGGLVLLDPREAPAFGYERLCATIRERLPLAGPEFGCRLREVPLGLARPYWQPDPAFDIANHVRRIAVPAPGGMRELVDLCGFLFSQKLDRRHPLWELWLIEGVEGGRVALFSKTHHALMDGMKGADLSAVLCDLEPNPAPQAVAVPEPRADLAEPRSTLGLAVEGVLNVATLPIRLASYSAQALLRGVRMVPYLLGENASPITAALPRLSFNGEIGPRRGFACASVPMADVRALKDALGVKLNDVFVELSASAIRRYLARRGEANGESLAVACAVSTRSEGDGSANRLATMVVSCAGDVEDPLARVRKIHENANRAKEMTARIRSTPIASLGEVLPPSVLNLGFRTILALSEWMPLPTHALVSNVPGPPVPLYLAGARIEGIYPFSILASSQGLNVTVFSFMDRVDFGFTVDPELVPEAWELAAGIAPALDELKSSLARRSGERSGFRKRAPAEADAAEATDAAEAIEAESARESVAA